MNNNSPDVDYDEYRVALHDAFHHCPDLTQADVARILGVRQQTVSNWLRASKIPDILTLQRLEAVLRVQSGTFFSALLSVPVAGRDLVVPPERLPDDWLHELSSVQIARWMRQLINELDARMGL